MYFNLAVLLIIASVAFAAQISFPGNVDDRMDDLLGKLETTVNNTIFSAELEIIEIVIIMNNTDIVLKGKTSTALSEIRNIWEKDIDELKRRAQNKSVNIDECLGQNAKTLMNLTAVFETEDYRCIRQHEIRILYEANNTYHRINRKKAVIREIKQEIELCEKAEACVRLITEQIETNLKKLPTEIRREAKQTVDLIQDIINNDISRCGTETIERFKTYGGILLARITSCVDGKIGH